MQRHDLYKASSVGVESTAHVYRQISDVENGRVQTDMARLGSNNLVNRQYTHVGGPKPTKT